MQPSLRVSLLTFKASHDICKFGRDNVADLKLVQYDDHWEWQFMVGRDGQVSIRWIQSRGLSTHKGTVNAKRPLPCQTAVGL